VWGTVIRMPQPKQPRSSASRPTSSRGAGKSAGGGKKPAARKQPAKPADGAATTPAAAVKPKATSTGAKRSAPAARKPARADVPSRGPAGPATQPRTFTKTEASEAAAARDDAVRANLAQLRDLLAGGIVLTPQRLQETLDEAVARGRMVRQDAEELTRSLLSVGRQQTQDLLGDLEQLLGTGAKRARSRATQRGGRVLREVDKARRRVGVPPTFPILGYDDLAAAQVTTRLGDLTPPELRKVRDYERRNANRKSVLNAIEKALG
jgi:polyhydroxyalkanoate synthesis regulator phasin